MTRISSKIFLIIALITLSFPVLAFSSSGGFSGSSSRSSSVKKLKLKADH